MATTIAAKIAARRAVDRACTQQRACPASGAYCFGSAAPKRDPPPAAGTSAKRRAARVAVTAASRSAPRRAAGNPAARRSATRPALSRWHAAVDARDASFAQMLQSARSASVARHRGPRQSAWIVTSSSLATIAPRDVEMARQTTQAPTVRTTRRPARARSHTKPIGMREEQVERTVERRRSAIAVHRGGRAVMRVVRQECAQKCARVAARRRGHRGTGAMPAVRSRSPHRSGLHHSAS